MSADNGVYILKTDGPEYRVAHLQAVERVWWHHGPTGETNNPHVHIENARTMWEKCKVYKSETQALKEATKLLRTYDYVEYGISFIEIPLKF